MKKLLICLLLLVSLLPLAASVGGGYSIAPIGEKSPTGDSFGAVSFSAIFSPWIETHVFDIETEVLLSPVSPFFNGVNIKVSSPIYLFLKHPFKFMFPNAVYYAPRLSVGAQYRMEKEWNLYMSISLLSFQDTNYTYEFLSPYALYNFNDGTWGYGAYIMRFSAFFGGR